MKKFFSLVLALVMALSLTTAAWGAEAITTQEALNAAVANGGEIVLGEGTFKLPDVKNKDITLIGAGVEKTTVDYSHMGGYQEVSGSSFVFKNMTVKCAEKGWPYPGLQHTTSVSYENCHILGTVNLFCPATFKNCTFDSGKAEHNAVTYGSDSVTFENCEFTYADRAVNCYAEDASARNVAVSFTDCTFTKVAGKDSTGAIETNSSLMNSLSVTINKCSVNEGKLWFVADPYDSLKGAKTSVAIDPTVDNGKYTGGTFNTDPAANVAEGYAVKNTGTAFEVYKLENKDAATTTTTTSGNTTTVEDVVIDSTAPSTIIDVTTDEETTEVVLDASAAAEVFPTTNAKPVEIVTTEASVTFDEDAAETIGTNAAGAAVSLEVEVEVAPEVTDVETANTAAYNEVMANADADNAVLLSIELTAGTTELFPDAPATKGTATVKVALPAGLNTAKLYYLDGADAEYLGEYTADANGYIYVELEHFSQYVIVGGTRTVVSGNTGNANGSYSSSTVNGTTTTASVADKYVIYPAGATNVLTNVNTNAFVVKSYTSLSTWTVVSNGVTTQSYIPAYYTLTDGTKLYEADENCGEYRLFKDGVFVTYLNDLNGAIGSGNYVDGDFIADAATYVAKSKGCDTYNVDVYMLNGKVPTMVNKDGWNVAVINGKVAVYSNLPAGSYTAHTFTDEVTYKSTTDLTVVAIECDKCEKSFQVVKTSKLPATYKGATAPLFFGGNNYYILLESAAVSGNTGVVGGTTTGKVESAATFDAGIAMYVGMSVMAAAGSAVVLKKRED